ncbi:MAG: DNA polymerase III subunit delta' [Rhodobacteraceae bacterium]|nr:DNA polymerase III subunit delta' [Paracoccaceae bacterium]
MSDETAPESDRAPDAPHPRAAQRLFGHAPAEAELLAAVAAGRLHHAWLITGPPGIGKATLAWRTARFLLDRPVAVEAGLFGADPTPPATLDSDHDSPRGRRITALSEPGLFLLRRGWDDKTRRHHAVITVDEVRALKGFFSLSLPDGGRRVVIVDSADDLNPSAANALLKLLEEPPANACFLLVSHQPSRLLPTIRSRCRRLACAPLAADVMQQALSALLPDLETSDREALATSAGGSIGAALRIHALDGIDLGRAVGRLVATMPGVDRMQALALSASLAQPGSEERRTLFLHFVDDTLAGLARQGARASTGSPQSALAPSPSAARRWAEAQQTETQRVRRGLAVNLDAQALILDMVLRIDRLAALCAADR